MAGHWIHLAIIAFFAVTWILNQVATKEERPGMPSRRPTPAPGGREPSLRFGQTNSASSAEPPRQTPRRNAAVSNDVMIIREEGPNRSSVRTQPYSKPQPSPAASAPSVRRSPRARPASASKRPSVSSRAHTPSETTSAAALSRQASGLPSMTAFAAAAAQASRAAQETAVAPMTNITAAPPSPITLGITAALNDRERMREAFVLTELFGRPKALKPRRSQA